MVQQPHAVHHSFSDYVAFERGSNVKHEFLGGRIYAMAGGTPEHALLTATVNGLLFAQLQGKPCRVYSSDLRVRAADLVTYPSVTVVCDPMLPDPADANTVLNPRVVVEVTSPSTHEYDKGEKLDRYRQIESLGAVVIVSHDQPHITVWSKKDSGWQEVVANAGGRIDIEAIDCTLLVDDVYGLRTL